MRTAVALATVLLLLGACAQANRDVNHDHAANDEPHRAEIGTWSESGGNAPENVAVHEH